MVPNPTHCSVEPPTNLPDGCVHFGPEQLLDEFRGSTGNIATIYIGTGSLAGNSGGAVNRAYEVRAERYSPFDARRIIRDFGDVPLERIYDGLSMTVARSLLDTGVTLLEVQQLDDLLVKPEYLV
jgi:hypothetical protein